MERNSYCTSENFKRNLSELCDKCPLKEEINNLIVENLRNAKEKKDILSKRLFIEFVDEEVRINSDKMSQLLKLESTEQNNTKSVYRKNRIKNYILMKEWIKGLRILLEDKKKKDEELYSPKEIKIAFFCLGEKITEENYLKILKKYSSSRSNKILQNPIYKSNQLTRLSGDKGSNTKHLKSLKNAQRLLSGINDSGALKSINQYISAFESNLEKDLG
ncbi:hypothetical protein KUL156_41790 [Alteromonas sp. KUL156]|nr:hypothetical protein KUL154_09370 [Alteromonas sp. KUL154]GFE01587.1 hypothetical protein KUL156_41790 [Alteromonas sp. KUL156]